MSACALRQPPRHLALLSILGLLTLTAPAPASAQEQGSPNSLRIASFNTELHRRGPGLLLRDILAGDPQAVAVAAIVAEAQPDILALQSVDYDRGGAALGALQDLIAAAGHPMPHRFARPPNTGIPTGADLDGDGRKGGPRDAQGFGYFAGQGGMAVLSRFPIDAGAAVDLSSTLWADLPDGLMVPGDAPEGVDQRLSTTGHWIVPIDVAEDGLHLLTWHATPPVFDGPEDRNGRRNHDEAALWLALLDDQLPQVPTSAPVIVAGDANLDVADGDGRPAALARLLDHPRLQDPRPRSAGGSSAAAQGGPNDGHKGDAAHDTADWPEDGPGNLRVDYILPDACLTVLEAGVLWPDGDPLASTAAAASRHRLVWVDVAWPPGRAPADPLRPLQAEGAR